MTFEEFYKFVDKTLGELIETIEIYADAKFDVQEIEFEWASYQSIKAIGRENVILEIMDKVFVDETHIYPCIDLCFHEFKDGIFKITGRRAGYEPREFGIGWSGRKGPFIYCSNIVLSDEKQKKAQDILIERGLLHRLS